MVPEGAIAVPLFLVESVINLLFYFLIAHALPVFMGKRYRNGDATFSYFIAYGFVRMCMEPLRNPTFIMGVPSSSSDGIYDLSRGAEKSLIMAIAFIAFGLIAIILNHIICHFVDTGKIRVKRTSPVVVREDFAAMEKDGTKNTEFDFAKLKEKSEKMKKREEEKKEDD